MKILNELEDRIRGWGGGKGNGDDRYGGEGGSGLGKKVMVLCGEGEDDVMCMGGRMGGVVEEKEDVDVG